MEDNSVINQTPKEREGGYFTFILGFLSVLILLGALGGVAYYYFVLKKDLRENEAKSSNYGTKEIQTLVEQIQVKNNQIKAKDDQIKLLTQENAKLKNGAKGMIGRLNYIIKPNAQMIAECYSAKLGQWQIPAKCQQMAQKNLSELLNSNKKVVALEVIGVVDERQYTGRNPELKQEGLASFRAKEVIRQMRQLFPNVVFFTGASEQKNQKRGFAIRAYYVQ